MASIVIYCTLNCPYCDRAKELFKAKGVSYQEFLVDKDPERRKEMMAKSNGSRTVPQIFINGKHIGGFSDLKELDDVGKLDRLLDN